MHIMYRVISFYHSQRHCKLCKLHFWNCWIIDPTQPKPVHGCTRRTLSLSCRSCSLVQVVLDTKGRKCGHNRDAVCIYCHSWSVMWWSGITSATSDVRCTSSRRKTHWSSVIDDGTRSSTLNTVRPSRWCRPPTRWTGDERRCPRLLLLLLTEIW